MKAPEFWYPNEAAGLSWSQRLFMVALSPFAFLYRIGGRLKHQLAIPLDLGVPVICVGNLSVGGTGKTPLTMFLARFLAREGWTPNILTRGYGGGLLGPVLVNPEVHTAVDVGDEPLLLSREAPVWVSRQRSLGGLAAVSHGADLVLMDDGFQNPQIQKTISIVVVDGGAGFGNGRIVPAGPLREAVAGGLARADCVVVMGACADQTKTALQSFDGPVFFGGLMPSRVPAINGPLVAFAGIGRPEKFFHSLANTGLNVVQTFSYEDHYAYRAPDLEMLASAAEEANAKLITTEKDWMRLPYRFRGKVEAFAVETVIENQSEFEAFLTRRLAERSEWMTNRADQQIDRRPLS